MASLNNSKTQRGIFKHCRNKKLGIFRKIEDLSGSGQQEHLEVWPGVAGLPVAQLVPGDGGVAVAAQVNAQEAVVHVPGAEDPHRGKANIGAHQHPPATAATTHEHTQCAALYFRHADLPFRVRFTREHPICTTVPHNLIWKSRPCQE